MNKFVIAALAAMTMTTTPASAAAIINFANDADTNGERGVSSGSIVTIDGVNLRLSDYPGAASPYFTADNAGLGICQVLTANDLCNPDDDSSVTQGETLEILFLNEAFSSFQFRRDILGIAFRDADHNLLGAAGNDGMVNVQTSSGTLTETFSYFIAAAANGDAFFKNTKFIRLGYVDTSFYLSSLNIPGVPVPAALPLMLSGIAGLGFASRRRKRVK